MTEPALPSLAEAALAAGRADLAGELARLESTQPQGDPAALHRRGLDCLNAGRFAEAETDLKLAIRLAPRTALLHDHLGVAIAQQNRYREAAATFAVAVRLAPTEAAFARNYAQALRDCGDLAGAIAALESARRLAPDDLGLVIVLAAFLAEAGRLPDAVTLLESVRESHAARPELFERLGAGYGHLGRFEEAATALETARNLGGAGAQLDANLAAAYGKLKRYPESIAAARRAVAADPNLGNAWSNLGNALRDLGDVQPALEALGRAVEIDPNHAEAWGNLALARGLGGDWPGALAAYARSLAIKPDDPEVRFNRAVALLATGDEASGWREYEWRWKTAQMRATASAFSPGPPAWRGEPLAGKALLVRSEQGLGDTLQMSRLFAMLVGRGARVLAAVPIPLRTLFASIDGVVEVRDIADPSAGATGADFQITAMSLPLLLNLRTRGLPPLPPHLTAPAELAAKWRARLAELPGRKVGVAWQGNPAHPGDCFRSMPPAELAPLAAVPGVTLVSLQRGPGSEQADAAPLPIVKLGHELDADMADAAGLLTALDGFVTIDSGLAHLAGGLGVPTWILLARNNDWRWGTSGGRTPWYPSVRLARQRELGEWGPAVGEVAASGVPN